MRSMLMPVLAATGALALGAAGTVQAGGGNRVRRSVGSVQAGPTAAAPSLSVRVGRTRVQVDTTARLAGGGNDASRSIGTAQAGGGNSADRSAATVQSGPVLA